jgi:membrane-associated protease RseP (regulator of RpoE activity)
MKRFFRGLTAAAVVAAAPALAVMLHQPHQALADDAKEGRVVTISPDSDDAKKDEAQTENAEEVKEPQYWIGLGGAPILDPALRTQLQLADDVGVLVESVVPKSPADKAGLRQHDIIVAVNGEPISDIRSLQKVVGDNGKKPIELKIIRLAKEQTVKVTPEDRPADAPKAVRGGGEGLNDLQRMLQQGGAPGNMRIFGNGMVFGGPGLNLNQMPNDISVSINREGDQPATITVKKGDKTWTVKGDDEKALKELPADVRPFVQQMLHGTRAPQVGGGGMNFNFNDMQKMLGDLGQMDLNGAVGDDSPLGQRMKAARERTEAARQKMQQRLEQMEKQIEKLQEQIDGKTHDHDRTNPSDHASKT